MAEERVSMTAALKVFCEEHPTVDRQRGNSLYLGESDKDTLRQILISERIDPSTPPDAWEGKTRTEALALGNDEKLTSETVKRRRVAVKALTPSAPIDLGSGAIRLPARCHIEIDFETISAEAHDWIVVVENWECFNDIHLAADRLSFPGRSPLVVWRGDTSATRADAMMEWLAGLNQPVAAFVDYDPSGLIIAASLPRLKGFVAPDLNELARLLRENGLHERFQAQLSSCQRALDLLSSPIIRPMWELIRREGRALPQEHFIRSE
jgi:hypothetical protein